MSTRVRQEPRILGKIQRMPQEILEEVFSYLSYEQVSKIGRECRSFREAARSLLYRAIGKIMTRIDEEIVKIEKLSKIQLASPPSDAGTYQQIHHAALLTILKMCSSELRILYVCCARYMRDREFDFCFPGGDLLDDFDAVVKAVRRQTAEPDERVDGDVTTSLFIKTGRFLDFFDAVLETVVTREVPLGVVVLDVLGCSQASDFVVELSHAATRSCCQLTGRYELRDTGTGERPPELRAHPLAVVRAKVLVRYLRNYVRWNNLFAALHKLWALEEERRDENNNMADRREDAARFFEDLARARHQWKHISDTADVCRDVFQETNSTLDSPLGVALEFRLCSRDLPMCLESLRGNHIKLKDSQVDVVAEGPRRDACIQTELSYMDAPPPGGTEFAYDAVDDVDPDRVLDYVQCVKKSLTSVRDVVDRLTVLPARPGSPGQILERLYRPGSPGIDLDGYYSSTDSMKTSPLSLPDSTMSFPYQCSAVSLIGDLSAATTRCQDPVRFEAKHAPSRASVVYRCSVQSLPREPQRVNFILKARQEKSRQGSRASLDSEPAAKRPSSATRHTRRGVSPRRNAVTTRPSSTNGLAADYALLEKLSARCVALAATVGAEEDVEKRCGDEGDDVGRGAGRLAATESKSCVMRQLDVVPEFVDSENFVMQMKIHYMSEDNELAETVVTVDCLGKEIVIESS